MKYRAVLSIPNRRGGPDIQFIGSFYGSLPKVGDRFAYMSNPYRCVAIRERAFEIPVVFVEWMN